MDNFALPDISQALYGTPTTNVAAPKGNALTAGLAAGYHEAVGQVGGALEATGQAFGLPTLQEYGRGVAENRANLARAAGREDLEENKWSPSGILYQIAKGVPSAVGMVGAGVAGAALAPELGVAAGVGAVGAGALAGYPLMVGGNVEASKAANQGVLKEGEGGRALAYGVPEAAIGAVGPGMLGKTLVGGVAREGLSRTIAGRALLGAAETAPVMGVQSGINTAVVQSAFGDPNKPVGDRAREIVDSFFSGGLQGIVLGGATHALSRSPNVDNKTLVDQTDNALGRIPPERQLPAPDQPLQLEDQSRAPTGTPRLRDARADYDPTFDNTDARPKVGEVETPPVDPNVQVTTDATGQLGFAGMSNADLMQARDAVARRSRQEDAPVADLVNQEIANRTQPGMAAGEGTLFTPEEMGSRKVESDAIKTRALEGVKDNPAKDFIEGLRSANEPEMVNELSRAMVDTPALKKTPWFRDLAQRFGVMDEKGAPLDVDTLGDRLETLRADAEKLWNRSKREGDGPARVAQDKQRQAVEVQKLIDLHTQADELLTKARPATDDAALADKGNGEPSRESTPGSVKVDVPATVPDRFKADYQSLGELFEGQPPTEMQDRITALRDKLAAASNLRGVPQAIAKLKSDIAKTPRGNISPETAARIRAKAAEDAQAIRERAAAEVAPEPETPPTAPETSATAASTEDLTHWQQFEQRRTISPAREVATTAEDRARQAMEFKRVGERVVPERQEGAVMGEGTDIPEGPTRPQGMVLDDQTPQPRRRAAAPKTEEEARAAMRSRDIERTASEGADRAINAETAARNATLTENLRDRLESLANDQRLSGADRALARSGKLALSSSKMQEIVDRIDPATKRTVEATAQIAPDVAGEPLKPTRAKRQKDGSPSFAEAHTADLNGEAVFDNGDHALIRGVDQMGDPIYVAADRATGQRTVTDIAKADAPWITPEVRQRLMTERAKAERADQTAFEKNPEGPFKTADSIVSTDGVEPKYTQFVDDLMRGLGLGNLKVFLTTPRDMASPDAVSKHSLNGPYRSALAAALDDANGSAMAFGPGAKQFAIHIDPTLPEARVVETLAHEVGHVVYTVAYRNAAPNVRAQIDTAFQQFLKKTTGASLQDLIKSTRNRATAEAATVGMDRNAMGSMDQRAYYREFSEWFSDQVSRYATLPPDAPQPQTMIGKFFASVAQKVRSMISTLRGDTDITPTDAVKDFLDNMRPEMADTFMREAHGAEPTRAFDTRAADPGTPLQQERDYSRFALDTSVVKAGLDRVMSALPGSLTVKESVRKLGNYVTDTYRMAQLHKDVLPSAPEYSNASKNRDVRQDRLAYLASEARKPAEALRGDDLKNTLTLIQGNNRGLDHTRTWEQHPDLHNLPDAPEYKAMLDKMRSATDALRRAGKLDAYQSLADANAAQRMIIAAEHMAIGVNGEFRGEMPGFDQTFMQKYQMQSDLHGKARPTRDAVAADLQARVAEIDAYRNKITGTLSTLTDPAQLAAAQDKAASLAAISGIGTQALAEMQGSQYFHMGRSGDHYVGGYLPRNADGTINADKARAFAKRLDDAGYNVVVDTVGDHGVFVKMKTPDQAARLEQVFRAAQKDGELGPEGVSAGKPDDVSAIWKSVPAVYQRIVEKMKNSTDYPPEIRDTIVRELTRDMLDTMQSSGNRRLMAQRIGVQGYSRDALQNFAFHQGSMAKAIANLSAAQESGRAMEGMRADNEALKRSDVPYAQKVRAQAALDEFLNREASRDWRTHDNLITGIRSFTHSVQLGLSLPYAALATSQLGTHAIPQMAAEHGYARTVKATQEALGPTIKAMTAILSGPNRWDVMITKDALDRSGLSKGEINTLLRADNRGDLSLGAPTRNLGRIADGQTDTGLAWIEKRMNVTSSAAELAPRIATALAAAKMYDERPVKGYTRDEYVSHVISESLQNWNSGNSARAVGSAGFAGKMTPLFTQFSSYQVQFLGKLYQEIGNALGRGVSPEEAARSRKFLAGHLIGATAVAGTLGMPFAGALAGVTDKLANFLTGKDDFDVEGSYRSWLADVFGKDAANVVAKGVPRALGFDLSHAGDQDLLPFTRLLTDRRKFEDSVSDWASQAMGSSFSLFTNAAMGAREMGNGNWLAGAQKFVPAGMKGAVEAYRMSQNGYENSKGVKLPLTPTTQDILMRAIGFKPADITLEHEREDLVRGLDETKSDRRKQITTRYERGVARGDQGEALTALLQGRDFIADHPQDGQALMNTFRTLPLQNLRETATARATGMPLGVGMRDVETRSKLRF